MAEVSKAVRLMRIYDADIVSAYRLDRTGEGPDGWSTATPTTT